MRRPPLARARRPLLPARRAEPSIFLLAVGQTLITPITGREYMDADISMFMSVVDNCVEHALPPPSRDRSHEQTVASTDRGIEPPALHRLARCPGPLADRAGKRRIGERAGARAEATRRHLDWLARR